MPLFSVRGKFADNFTFSVPTVDGSDARDALGLVMDADEIKNSPHGKVKQFFVKALAGDKRRIRISDKPASERKGGRRKKTTDAPATAAPTTPAPAKRR